MAAVLALEREAFPTQWPTPRHELLGRHGLSRYLVAAVLRADRRPQGLWPFFRRRDDEVEAVVGYLGMWLPGQEAHIVAVAVAQPWRRQGFGELLLLSALGLASSLGKKEATLECRVSNTPALALYEKYGFRRVAVRPRYYSDNQEDAYVMVREGLDTLAFQHCLSHMKEEYRRRWGPWEDLVAVEVQA